MNFNTKRAYYDSFRKGKKFEYNCISKFCFVFLTNNGIKANIRFHYIDLH